MQSTDLQQTMALRALEKQVSNLVALKVSDKGYFRPINFIPNNLFLYV